MTSQQLVDVLHDKTEPGDQVYLMALGSEHVHEIMQVLTDEHGNIVLQASTHDVKLGGKLKTPEQPYDLTLNHAPDESDDEN